MAVTASYIVSAQTLSTLGDALNNTITLSRNAAGTILVNGGAVAVTGGTPTVANTALMQVFGQGGNDSLQINENNGALPSANLFGGVGNDVIVSGSGTDLLFGQSENDTLIGGRGNDQLFGGSENDVLTGGDGDDRVFGESGDDRMIWKSGDGTDLFEGGAGTDTAAVDAGNGAEIFTVTANGTRVRFDRLDPAPSALDIGTTERLVVNLNGGNDQFSATGNLAALINIAVDGGAGNDTILGSNGIDLLLGGDGNDFIDGQQGNDIARLGAGDDTFQWDPGDGSDTVEGEAGIDTLLFNGSGGNEIFGIAGIFGRVSFTRNLGTINMSLKDIETLHVNALGGTDAITVNDLAGTGMTKASIDLSGTLGGTAGDGSADVVAVNANNANNTMNVVTAGSTVTVNGLSAQVRVDRAETADRLIVNGLGGDDTINANALTDTIAFTADGGTGNDVLTGGAGKDTLLGGVGNDVVAGRQGNDKAFLGAGIDLFTWNPGDGSDVVEGQAELDTLVFNGADIAENIDIVANGQRTLLFRNIANVTMDLDGMETVNVTARGGADNVVVGDLTGTAVRLVNIDLATVSRGNTGDNQADTVTVNATNGDDVIAVDSTADGRLTVDGLQVDVAIRQAEAANDRLTINALGGDDVINASGVEAGRAKLTINGGLGEDVMIGGDGDDLFNGGDGNDTALMGAGNDTFVWNPGDDNDTLEGQDGTDTMLFNGANIAERITISANGGRVLFFRDIANVLMDLNDVETIDFNALGGADNIVINDLSGTDVNLVNLDLAATGGGADGQPDSVTIMGTNGNDTISLSIQNGKLVVNGLATQVVIENFETNLNDRININGLGGDDVIDASGLGAIGVNLVFDGGAGNDVLIGGGNDDVLNDDAGDDVLIGSGGNDILIGGSGDNLVFQDGAGADAAGVVALFGTGNVDNMTVSRNAAGAILANGVALPGNPTVANTGVIQLFGKDNNDVLTLSETNGALPRADLFGGAGNDVATGGAGGDQIFGETGNDTLLGKGGFDLLFGGEGNDTLTGGDDDDQMFGQGGDDRMIWNPGDDTDLFEGGTGTDTVEVNGGGAAEVFTATANGTRVRFDRLDPAPFTIDIGTSENLVLNMNGGDDRFSATGNLAALIKITVDGGAGDDTILGSNGIDLLFGGDGNDFIDGQQGNDVAFLGAGKDTFQWDPGDGNDVVEGQDGGDTLLFNGSNGSEIFEVSANGGRALFTRNLGNIVMDLDDVEAITLNALGGTDTLKVNDLSGTDLTKVSVNLAGIVGGASGDTAIDSVVTTGTNGADTVTVSNIGATVNVNGLKAQVEISKVEVHDQVTVLGLAGDDVITASAVTSPNVRLTLDGGDGSDTLIGGAGADLIAGGAGNDDLFGVGGQDKFLFNTALNAATNVDTVSDFNASQDAMLLAKSVFTALTGNAGVQLAANEFFVGTAAHDADDRIIYNASTGALIYDSNGNVAGGAVQFATLESLPTLSHTSFLLA